VLRHTPHTTHVVPPSAAGADPAGFSAAECLISA
jgi:hypothetical protein